MSSLFAAARGKADMPNQWVLQPPLALESRWGGVTTAIPINADIPVYVQDSKTASAENVEFTETLQKARANLVKVRVGIQNLRALSSGEHEDEQTTEDREGQGDVVNEQTGVEYFAASAEAFERRLVGVSGGEADSGVGDVGDHDNLEAVCTGIEGLLKDVSVAIATQQELVVLRAKERKIMAAKLLVRVETLRGMANAGQFDHSPMTLEYFGDTEVQNDRRTVESLHATVCAKIRRGADDEEAPADSGEGPGVISHRELASLIQAVEKLEFKFLDQQDRARIKQAFQHQESRTRVRELQDSLQKQSEQAQQTLEAVKRASVAQNAAARDALLQDLAPRLHSIRTALAMENDPVLETDRIRGSGSSSSHSSMNVGASNEEVEDSRSAEPEFPAEERDRLREWARELTVAFRDKEASFEFDVAEEREKIGRDVAELEKELVKAKARTETERRESVKYAKMQEEWERQIAHSAQLLNERRWGTLVQDQLKTADDSWGQMLELYKRRKTVQQAVAGLERRTQDLAERIRVRRDRGAGGTSDAVMTADSWMRSREAEFVTLKTGVHEAARTVRGLEVVDVAVADEGGPEVGRKKSWILPDTNKLQTAVAALERELDEKDHEEKIVAQVEAELRSNTIQDRWHTWMEAKIEQDRAAVRIQQKRQVETAHKFSHLARNYVIREDLLKNLKRAATRTKGLRGKFSQMILQVYNQKFLDVKADAEADAAVLVSAKAKSAATAQKFSQLVGNGLIGEDLKNLKQAARTHNFRGKLAQLASKVYAQNIVRDIKAVATALVSAKTTPAPSLALPGGPGDPSDAGSVPAAPVATTPVSTSIPVPTAPVPTVPIPNAPVPTAPVPTAPVPTAPVSTAPVSTAPVSTAPVQPVSPVPTAPAEPPTPPSGLDVVAPTAADRIAGAKNTTASKAEEDVELPILIAVAAAAGGTILLLVVSIIVCCRAGTGEHSPRPSSAGVDDYAVPVTVEDDCEAVSDCESEQRRFLLDGSDHHFDVASEIAAEEVLLDDHSVSDEDGSDIVGLLPMRNQRRSTRPSSSRRRGRRDGDGDGDGSFIKIRHHRDRRDRRSSRGRSRRRDSSSASRARRRRGLRAREAEEEFSADEDELAERDSRQRIAVLKMLDEDDESELDHLRRSDCLSLDEERNHNPQNYAEQDDVHHQHSPSDDGPSDLVRTPVIDHEDSPGLDEPEDEPRSRPTPATTPRSVPPRVVDGVECVKTVAPQIHLQDEKFEFVTPEAARKWLQLEKSVGPSSMQIKQQLETDRVKQRLQVLDEIKVNNWGGASCGHTSIQCVFPNNPSPVVPKKWGRFRKSDLTKRNDSAVNVRSELFAD